MPASVGYALGRVSVKRRESLDDAKIERLLGCATLNDAVRTLQEIGWAGGDKSASYEALIAQHIQEACAFMREVSPDPSVTDSFLLRWDINNLKMLLKARCLSQQAQFLTECGTIPVSVLTHAVTEGVYKRLPPVLAWELDALEKRMAQAVDPMDIDVTLDRAMFTLVFQQIKHVSGGAIGAYFRGRVDLTNVLILLRVKAMGRDASFAVRMLLDGGNIPHKDLLAGVEAPERMMRLLAPYGRGVTSAYKAALESKNLAGFEKVVDDHLLGLFEPYQNRTDALEALIGYFLAQLSEAAAVRLILAGKANSFTTEAVRERLRALYGK